MLDPLKKQVIEAAKAAERLGALRASRASVSGVDRATELVVIAPQGIAPDAMQLEDLVLLDLNGRQVEGNRLPAPDAQTHVALYRAFADIGGIAHVHTTYATAWAQAGFPLPPLGVLHAANFSGDVPCTRRLSARELEGEYEKHIGQLIAETFTHHNVDPLAVPAVLVASHGPFAWGSDTLAAIKNAAALEEAAQLAVLTTVIRMGHDRLPILQQELIDKLGTRRRNTGYHPPVR